MEKMNELVELAERADSVGNLMDAVNPHTILAISQAFRALERRAEAAESNSNYNGGGARYWHDEYCAQQQRLVSKIVVLEAKLAALANQEPVHFRPFGTDGETYVKCSPDHIDAMAFWQCPAPAADLSELVEDEATLTAGVNALVDCLEDCGDAEQGLRLALRAILRKIEEVKK